MYSDRFRCVHKLATTAAPGGNSRSAVAYGTV